jgi:hypothetical protein
MVDKPAEQGRNWDHGETVSYAGSSIEVSNIFCLFQILSITTNFLVMFQLMIVSSVTICAFTIHRLNAIMF